jgi:hypothetical protein
MAFTPEQQAQIDIQLAVESDRHTKQSALEAKRAKLEALRMAKETLAENNRSKPADSREVTAEDITAFADKLITYVNA